MSNLNYVKLHCDEIKSLDGQILVTIGSNCINLPGWIEFESTSTVKNELNHSLNKKHVGIRNLTIKDVLSAH